LTPKPDILRLTTRAAARSRRHIERKRSEGKTHREALRALKRQLVRTVFRLLQEGAASAKMAA
jgi:hypothetical protein